MVASLTFRPSQAATRIRFIALAVVAIVSLVLLVASPSALAKARGCRHANTVIAHARRAQLQKAVVCLVNQERRSHGLPALRATSQLNRSAQGWSNVMVTDRDFTHGADFAARITSAGVNWSNAGENIATGYTTPRAVVAGWMASPGHCRNILSPVFREVGTGVANGKIPGFSSQDGTWTQDFALLMGQAPASNNWGPADNCPYN